MKSSLVFPVDKWEAVLPQALLVFKPKCITPRPGLPPLLDDMWNHIPRDLQPKILTLTSDAFFQALTEGKDTRDIKTFTSNATLMELIGFLNTQPAGLVTIVSRPINSMDTLTSFIATAFTEANKILQEENVQDGILDNKLLTTKAKILSNARGQIEAVLKLHREVQDYPPSLGNTGHWP